MEGCPVHAYRTLAVHCILVCKVLTDGVGHVREGDPSSLRPSSPFKANQANTHMLQSGTYVFVCGLVGADQVCVET